MTIKNCSQKNLLPIIFFLSLVSTSGAEQAVLTEDLKRLHIPIIQYQNQYLWADLDYQANSSNPIIFTVKEYGLLPETSIPPNLHDLSLVTDGAPPAIVDIKETEARLTFVSSIPLACSVVYGKTPLFGAVSIDASMNGGAIINHNPVLTNLEPDTLYYYRVQGTDAHGKLYWEPTGSFTTASENTSKTNLLSLANGASISAVSSNFGNVQNDQAWGANSAIDDSGSTAWSSNGDGNNAFIKIELAQSAQMDSISVWSRSMADGTARINSFTITIDSGEVLGPFTLPDSKKSYQFPLNRASASIRLDVVSSSGGNTGLMEISAFVNNL